MSKILILDGYPWVRELLREELGGDGYRIEAVDAIGKAVEIEKRVRFFQPDLILLDLYIHGEEQWDLLRKFKHLNPSLPVLIFTAYEGYRQDPRAILADGYVTKSFLLDELKQKIAKILKKKGRGLLRPRPPSYAWGQREGKSECPGRSRISRREL